MTGNQAERSQAHEANIRNSLKKTSDMRDKLRQHAKSIGPCDGSSRELLRAWLTGIDHAKVWVPGCNDPALIEMMSPLIRGPLANFLTQIKKRANDAQTQLTWDGLKSEIKKTFLAPDEDDRLREALDRVVQSQYEEVQSYIQRFREALRLGYTTDEQAVELIKRKLIKQFIAGLRDWNIRHDVNRQNPDSFDKAYELAGEAERAIGRTNQGGPPMMSQREEEPMEIGAAGNDPGLAETLKQMEKRFEKRFDSLERRLPRPKPQQGNAQFGRRRYNPDIKCFGCGQKGHIQRKCPRPNKVNKSTEERLAALELAAANTESKN